MDPVLCIDGKRAGKSGRKIVGMKMRVVLWQDGTHGRTRSRDAVLYHVYDERCLCVTVSNKHCYLGN